MAGSRLEKIGTIYTRTRGLIQSGALAWNDRPVWYDVYEAFPPSEPPKFDRPARQLPLKAIFYDEDNIRALLHKKIKSPGVYNLSATAASKTFTQRFIDTYKKLDEQYTGSAEPEKLYDETLELLQREREARDSLTEGQSTIAEAFKDASAKQRPKEMQALQKMQINMKDIFKE